MGRIDALVCSAGIAGLNATTWQYPLDEWRKVIGINLDGVFHCNRAVIPIMLERDYGRIVNIASIAGKEGNPNASAYSASKAGVIGLTKIARQGAREVGHSRQLRHAGGGADRDLRPDHAAAHRLHALQDPAGTIRDGRRNRRAGRLAVHRGLLVLDGRGVRSFGRPRDVLIAVDPARAIGNAVYHATRQARARAADHLDKLL